MFLTDFGKTSDYMVRKNRTHAGGKAHSAPFCLMSAPCHWADVLSQGFAARIAAHGCALDSAEEQWHQSPKGFDTHRS